MRLSWLSISHINEWAFRTFIVIRYHENADGTTETEILDATKNADDTIIFKTDRFSTYAIAYSTNTAKSPITGQTGMTAIYLAFAVSAIVAVVYAKKRVYE